MRYAVICAACAIISSSCYALTDEQLKAYIANDAQAMADRDAGKIKWSEYYLISYYQVDSTNSPRKSIFLERYMKLTELAMAFEAGKISKEEFELGKLKISTEATRKNEALNREEAAAEDAKRMDRLRSALQNFSLPTNQFQPLEIHKTTTCTSTPNGVGGFMTTCR